MAAYISAAPVKHHRSSNMSVTGMIGGIVEWRKNRAAAAQLRAMPDHILDDLGLSRADIDMVAHYGRR